MKELLALLGLLFLVTIGWNQSFKTHLDNLFGTVEEQPAITGKPSLDTPKPGTTAAPPSAATLPPLPAGEAATSPSPDKSWLWRRTTMDEPHDFRKGTKGER